MRPFSFGTRRFSFRRKGQQDSVDTQYSAPVEAMTTAHETPRASESKSKKARRPGAIRRNTKKVIKQFSPHDFTKFEWGGTKSFTAYFTVVLLLSVFLAAELNPFYLKFLLWMEPDHPFVIARLVGVFLCGLPAVRELYQYMNDPR